MEKSGRKNRVKKDKGKVRASRAKSGTSPAEEDLISAIDHPLRRQVLRVMHSLGRPLSPREVEELLNLGGKLGSNLSNVSYHVKILAGYGAISLVGTRPARGALEHFYESRVSEAGWLLGLLDRTRGADEAMLWPKERRRAGGRMKTAKKPGR